LSDFDRVAFSQDRPLRAKGSRLQPISWVAQLLLFVSSVDLIVVWKVLRAPPGLATVLRVKAGKGSGAVKTSFRQNPWLAAS